MNATYGQYEYVDTTSDEDREVITGLLEAAVTTERQRLARAKHNAWQTVPLVRARAEYLEGVLARWDPER